MTSLFCAAAFMMRETVSVREELLELLMARVDTRTLQNLAAQFQVPSWNAYPERYSHQLSALILLSLIDISISFDVLTAAVFKHRLHLPEYYAIASRSPQHKQTAIMAWLSYRIRVDDAQSAIPVPASARVKPGTAVATPIEPDIWDNVCGKVTSYLNSTTGANKVLDARTMAYVLLEAGQEKRLWSVSLEFLSVGFTRKANFVVVRAIYDGVADWIHDHTAEECQSIEASLADTLREERLSQTTGGDPPIWHKDVVCSSRRRPARLNKEAGLKGLTKILDIWSPGKLLWSWEWASDDMARRAKCWAGLQIVLAANKSTRRFCKLKNRD
ncbi:hypothetical protein HKX48_009002 [Thoreauomyces humboldtii]|nr:hypothetical protein HKX48_009002 [Thoreauomyces humboldtii]